MAGATRASEAPQGDRGEREDYACGARQTRGDVAIEGDRNLKRRFGARLERSADSDSRVAGVSREGVRGPGGHGRLIGPRQRTRQNWLLRLGIRYVRP